VNAVNGTSATSASEIHRCSSSSQTAFGLRIGVHAASSIEAMAALTAGSIRAVTEKRPSGALFAVAVGPLNGVVHVHIGDLIGAGQDRGVGGQVHQQPRRDRVQLAHV
jgi:hypothetical protein